MYIFIVSRLSQKNKEMSSILISSIRGKCNDLGEDVLHLIFQLLKGEDLVNCEAVCRQWREVLLSERLWRKLFERQLPYCPLVLPIREKLESKRYRDVCRSLLRVKRDWVEGNFTTWTHAPAQNSAFNLETNGDYVAWNFDRREPVSAYEDPRIRGCAFVNTTTDYMNITEMFSVYMFHIRDEMGNDYWPYDNTSRATRVVIHDPHGGWILDVPVDGRNDYIYRPNRFTGKLLVCYSASPAVHRERFRMWKIENLRPVLMSDRSREYIGRNKWIEDADDQFIVTSTRGNGSDRGPSLHFISSSSDSLEEFRSLSVMCRVSYIYQRGLLFQRRRVGIVRILDVASGAHFRDARLPFRREDEAFISVPCAWAACNSIVTVICWQYQNNENPQNVLSHLSVYDLERGASVKSVDFYDDDGKLEDKSADLLYTLQFQLEIECFVMDDTRLAFIGSRIGKGDDRTVTVLNFADFLKRRPVDLNDPEAAKEGVCMRIFEDLVYGLDE
jgi:hypothetical protein